MAPKDSRFELQEISGEVEGSDSDSDSEWGDSEEDPDYDILEETHSMLSNLSIKKKAKPHVVKGKEDLGTEKDPEVLEITAPCLDQEDEDKFGKVQKIIEAGELGKLKVDECKLYLRKNGLRLTGNKDTLIQRIKEHLEIINGGGEKKYPPSSFVFNCKGDACTGDVVLFEQNVYEMFSIASRSASGPPCGKRIVAGRIVRESYGAAKQQHTFTIEVLWSKGEKPLPPLHPLLIKGRNLYKLKTLRQKWEDERERQKILMEKHSRGFVARADREARIQEKEKRKAIMEDRVSKRDSVRNRCQSRRTVSQYQPQESDISIKPEKPVLKSKNSDLSANTRKATSQVQMFGSSAIVRNPAAVTQQWGKSVDSGRVAMGPDQLGRSFDSGKTSFPVHHGHNYQALKFSADLRSTFNIDQTMRAEVNANYKYPDIHSREKQSTIEKYPYTSETNGFTEWTHHLIQEKHNFLLGRSFDSRKTSFHVLHGYNHQALKCSAYSRSTFDIDQTRRDEVNANYNYLDIHFREKQTTIEKYPWTSDTNGFPQWTHHRKPLGNANHFLPMIPSRERYKPKQLCMHYARGRCYFGDNCKFSHDWREDIIPL